MTTPELIALFETRQDPLKAEGMKRYMKDISPYLGIARPERDLLQKAWLAEAKSWKWAELESAAKLLWNKEEREYQYAAMDMLYAAKAWKHEDAIKLLEWMLKTKSWWDTVDTIAARLVGPYFLEHKDKRDPWIEKWLNGENMWLQRTCLIFQLGYKNKTDFDLMKACILTLCGSKEFFIQKAIGWALRQYARTDGNAVIIFTENTELKPLSRREALKHLG